MAHRSADEKLKGVIGVLPPKLVKEMKHTSYKSPKKMGLAASLRKKKGNPHSY